MSLGEAEDDTEQRSLVDSNANTQYDLDMETSVGMKSDEELEDDDEDDEDDEPKLKFDRIKNDLKKILEKDAVSCVAVHSKFLCIGSHRGEIYILDPLGNNVTVNPRKSIEAHKVTVNHISISNNGEYIASCSDDGKVNIYSLCDGENVQTLTLNRKIRCIAIDPQYSKANLMRRFIIGDENVTLYQRNIFGMLKPSPLLEGGLVSNINWGPRFVAWSWRDEVRIYDIVDGVTVSRVQFEWQNQNIMTHIIPSGTINTASNEALVQTLHSKYRCNIFWKDAYTLFIGWADIIKICQAKRQNNAKIEQGYAAYTVHIICMFSTDFWCCGLSSFGNHMCVLGRDKEHLAVADEMNRTNGLANIRTPKLHILQPEREDYTIVFTHVLRTRGYQEYKIMDYHLESLVDELHYYIVTPKDIIWAKSTDEDDHIQWLIERSKFEEALEYASQNSKLLERHSVTNVGLAYLDHLMVSLKFIEAGKLCLKILAKENCEKWEEQVLKFARVGQLRSIAPYLPRSEASKLNSYIYEMILFDYLKNDQEAFLLLVRDWAPPPVLFNVSAIVNSVIDHLLVCEPDNRFLLQALADLYSYQNKYGKALAMYLKLQDPQVFQLIQRYGLFGEIKENIEDLMHLNMVEALNLFMKYKDRLHPTIITQQLKENRYYLYRYLDSLYKAEGKEMKPEFHGMMVCLYADYGPGNLLQFLKSSDHYPMQEALEICRKREKYPEMIFLLGRMGNAKEALRLITHELEDVDQAIEFCKENNDAELWADLINFSMDKPNYINTLLCNIGTYVDPQILIRRIENGLEIPGLRDSLVKIMQDYSLQVELQEGCKNILVGDSLKLFQKLVKTQLQGVFVEDDQECGSCHQKIVVKDSSYGDDVKVFYCKHVFHDACLSSFDYQNCIICNLPRKGIGLLEKL